ncbi:MAG: Bifunctional polymyxin resistance protein ArnA [candidate division WS6 bacterium OLB20]|uniref:Bifunctional polymyxin resistance protein ArnA n=1 Tax=candidate division WS6 bacterium OLB20 TaxID=1617426 RepID=A0A136M0L6_9BACT|nr:MAG: Bifunctional polymyxin resistance protein ArnA [candidate division WS6 bacterium OLB20]
MKVIILSQNDPLYTHFFFKRFVKEYAHQFDLQAVYLLAPMKDSLADLVRRTWEFYGPADFVRVGLQYARIKLREKLGHPVTPHNLLKKHGIAVEQIASVNSRSFLARVREHKPDVIVSVSCPQIFRQDLLSIPSTAALNIHSGKLPAYKGLFPNFWQMLNGESTSTVTIHEMVAKVDEGRIISETEIPIHPDMSLTGLIRETKEAAVPALFNVIRDYEQGSIKPFVNSELTPGYFRFPARRDVTEFRNKGLRLL